MAPTASFIAPPSDMEIEYTFDFHLAHNPNYPVFMRPDINSSSGKRSITYSEFVPGVHRAGKSIRKSTNSSSSSPTPLVAIFAEMSEYIQYLCDYEVRLTLFTDNMTYATIVLVRFTYPYIGTITYLDQGLSKSWCNSFVNFTSFPSFGGGRAFTNGWPISHSYQRSSS